MMQSIKKTVSIILAITMILSMVCAVPVSAAKVGGTYGDLTWTYADGILTISGSGELEGRADSWEVPWLTQELGIKSVIIEDGVTSIGCNAFYCCYDMENVRIPDSVTSIGDYAFGDCFSLRSILLPKNLIRIGDHAFQSCQSLRELVIPDSVQSIGVSAFYGCSSLRHINIPEHLFDIGASAFSACYSVREFDVAENNAFFSTRDGMLLNHDGTELLAIPGVDNCIIPDGVETIREGACAASNMLRLVLPDSVKWIEAGAFEFCEYLTSISFGSGLTEIGDYAFSGCYALERLTLPEGLQYIGNDAFWCCYWMEDLTIPSSVKQIGNAAFGYCSGLTTVEIPASVEIIGDAPFFGCNDLTGIHVAEDNPYYCSDDAGALYDKDMTQLINCPSAATFFAIPDGVEKICDGALSGYNLRAIEIPTSVTYFAFNSDELKEIYYPGTQAQWDANEYAAEIRQWLSEWGTQFYFETSHSECPGSMYIDMPAYSNWAHEGIDFCTGKGLMNGVGNGMFAPDGTVTRAQLVTILYRMAGEPAVVTNGTFVDVPMGQWYSNAIEWAAANNIVKGVGNGKFNPNASITREQIATILYRYEGSPAVTGTLTAFPDHANASTYAVNALVWATEKGLINGIISGNVTSLEPQNQATRAQIASIIMRYIKLSNKQ